MKNNGVGPHGQSNTGGPGVPTASQGTTASIVTVTADSVPDQPHALARARAFAEPLIASENILTHADAVAAILKSIGGSEAMQAATYLVHACQHLNKPRERSGRESSGDLQRPRCCRRRLDLAAGLTCTLERPGCSACASHLSAPVLYPTEAVRVRAIDRCSFRGGIGLPASLGTAQPT